MRAQTTYRARPIDMLFILHHGEVAASPVIFRDAPEDFYETQLARYFSNGWRIFTERLRKFKNSPRALDAREEKELKFMLEALIEAKRNLQKE